MYLGIDIGSVSLKYAVINNGDIIVSNYFRTHGDLLGALKNIFNELGKYVFSGIGVTGSGRNFIGALLEADLIVDEITAHRIAVATFYPEAKTIFEIGGQDSKLIYFTDNGINFEMNSACAAGTGSFLDQQAARLGMTIEEFYQKGLEAEEGYKIASKCTVFAETDMVNAQQSGIPVSSIIRGVHEGLINNYFSQLCRGRKFKGDYLFEGGTSENPLLIEELSRRLVKEELIHKKAELIIAKPLNKIMGAIGSALLCADTGVKKKSKLKAIEKVEFLGDDLCHSCSNQCRAKIKRYRINNKIVVIGKTCQ
jgi:predicted CoA-substrate-specific enzyme activase